MSDQNYGVAARPVASRPVPAVAAEERVVALPNARREEPVSAPTSMRDYGAALELVREASDAVRASESRVEELESELESVVWSAKEQARELTAQIDQAHARIGELEELLRSSEARHRCPMHGFSGFTRRW